MIFYFLLACCVFLNANANMVVSFDVETRRELSNANNFTGFEYVMYSDTFFNGNGTSELDPPVFDLNTCGFYCDIMGSCAGFALDINYQCWIYSNLDGSLQSENGTYIYTEKLNDQLLEYSYGSTVWIKNSTEFFDITPKSTALVDYQNPSRQCKAPTNDDDMARRINNYARRVEFDTLWTLTRTDTMFSIFMYVVSSIRSKSRFPYRKELNKELFYLKKLNSFDYHSSTIQVYMINQTAFLYPTHNPVIEVNVQPDGKYRIRRACVTIDELLHVQPTLIDMNINSMRYSGRCNDILTNKSIGRSWDDFVVKVLQACSFYSNYILSLVYGNELVGALGNRIGTLTSTTIKLDSDGTDFFFNTPMLGSIIFYNINGTTFFQIEEQPRTPVVEQINFLVNFFP